MWFVGLVGSHCLAFVEFVAGNLLWFVGFVGSFRFVVRVDFWHWIDQPNT